MNPYPGDRLPFDSERIAEHLELVGLVASENQSCAIEFQTQVVRPNVTTIVDKFHAVLSQFDEFNKVIPNESAILKLKEMHRRYLLSLGVRFQDQEYFEDRLRIGSTHQRAGISLRLYQCTYYLLQSLLIENIPEKIREDYVLFDLFVQFILKITALDMSLAIEAYHMDEVSRLERTVYDIRDKEQQLRQQLMTDSLTGLSSRAFALGSLATTLCSARGEDKPLCVLMTDLDHFKNINDTFGHHVGDHVLCGVARRMLAGAREVDIVGRYGGDEFLLILQDTDIAESKQIGERIRLKVHEHPLHVDNSIVKVTMSIGIARARDDDDVDSFIKRADSALYSAKLAGRDCICIEDEQKEINDAIQTSGAI